MTLFDGQEMTDEEKIKEAYKILRSVKDQVTRLFGVAWGRINNITAGERLMTEQLLKDYGYDVVRDSFQESMAHQKMNLAYVRVVAKQLSAKQHAKKNEEEGNKLKADLDKKDFFIKPDEEAKKWVNMFENLKEAVKIPEVKKDESYKQTPEYKQKQKRFLEEIN